MDLPRSLLSQEFIERTLSCSVQVLAVENNRAALEHIIVSVAALLDKARNNGLSSLDVYVRENIYPTEEANGWEWKDGVPCPLPPLVNMGVYIADGFAWENAAAIHRWGRRLMYIRGCAHHYIGSPAL